MFDAGGSELDVVPRVGFFHSGMMRNTQLQFVRLVQHRLHHVAINYQDLDAIRTHGFELANPGTRLFGIGGRWIAIKHRVDKNAWRYYFSFGTLFAKLQSFLSLAADIADGSDPARHPDFQFIIEWLRNAATLVLDMC